MEHGKALHSAGGCASKLLWGKTPVKLIKHMGNLSFNNKKKKNKK
jgi:hypothetical protein